MPKSLLGVTSPGPQEPEAVMRMPTLRIEPQRSGVLVERLVLMPQGGIGETEVHPGGGVLRVVLDGSQVFPARFFVPLLGSELETARDILAALFEALANRLHIGPRLLGIEPLFSDDPREACLLLLCHDPIGAGCTHPSVELLPPRVVQGVGPIRYIRGQGPCEDSQHEGCSQSQSEPWQAPDEDRRERLPAFLAEALMPVQVLPLARASGFFALLCDDAPEDGHFVSPRPEVGESSMETRAEGKRLSRSIASTKRRETGSSCEITGGTMDDSTLCVFNGVDGATGEYLSPALSVGQVADLARREPRYQLSAAVSRSPNVSRDKGPVSWVDDPRRLEQAGWGVIFAPGANRPEVREALEPLLAHRREQASQVREGRYKALTYTPGESKTAFLVRHGSAPGPADPDRMPYYLLLVGDPEEIPFELQYQLDVQYAVGRIHFDTVEEYAQYAHAVVAAETGRRRRSPAAAIFGPRNPNDQASALSSEHLAAPLARSLADQLPGWTIRAALAEDAKKARLTAFLEGDDSPAFLFTAGHGLGFRRGDSRQEPLQGSLICGDWPGPGHTPQQEHYFGADDVTANARIAGMIAFHFSCYGAGTPRYSNFAASPEEQNEIAPHAFLSRLARRLLAHPAGGALAVVGHVERAWSWSFRGLDEGGHAFRSVFESALKRLTKGYPIGFAMEDFNVCYAELASDLDDEIRRVRDGNDARLAGLWTGRNDARNYALLGDPAVRLAVQGPVQ
jgi:hypothetical protein